jgi:hypothetical protein
MTLNDGVEKMKQVGMVCFKVLSHNFPVRSEENCVRIAGLCPFRNFFKEAPVYPNNTAKSHMAVREKSFAK